MKYIDSEKLVAEINRVKDENAKLKWACASQISSAAFCKDEAYDEVLSFITSLQQEQPSLPSNLDEVAIDAAQLDMQDRQIMEDSNEHRMLYSRIFRRGFKAGAEWQRESLSHTMLTYAAEVFSGKMLIEDISYSYRQELADYFRDLAREIQAQIKAREE